MNKELNDKIGKEVDEIVLLSGSITTESFNKRIQDIINMCADDAIDAVKDGVISDPFLSIQYTRNNERCTAIKAIEKRMK